MLKHWHKKHVSTKWGMIVLGVLSFCLIIAVAQIDKVQNLFSRASPVNDDSNIDSNQCLTEGNIVRECRSVNDGCRSGYTVESGKDCGNAFKKCCRYDHVPGRECNNREPCPYYPESCISGRCQLNADRGSGDRTSMITINYAFVKNVDYMITVDKGTLTMPGASSYIFGYIKDKTYRYRNTRNSVKSITVVKSDPNAAVTFLGEWAYSSVGYRCQKGSFRGATVFRFCKYDAAISSTDPRNRCAPGITVTGTGGFLKEAFCPGGSNYRCCVTSVDNTEDCADLGGYCDVDVPGKHKIPEDGHYSSAIVCPGPNSLKCWIPK